MKIIGTEKFSSLMSIACLTITSIVFGSLFVTPQLLFAQGEANETFFEAAVREAGQTEQQQNQTEAAPPSPQPSSTEPQQNQTESQNPIQQPGKSINKQKESNAKATLARRGKE
jgi:hypothetical protein